MRSFKVKRKAFSVFFTLVLIPILLIGIMLSSDCARIIMASHSASLLADNLSMVASTGIAEDNLTLDTTNGGLVYKRVNELFAVSMDAGAISPDIEKSVKVQISNLQPTSVTVLVTYKINDLILLNYIGGKSFTFSGSVSRSSGPCVSNGILSCAYLA